MIYVAFLRGINVGGKARVEMSKLREVFAAAGCQQVSTYINSGNVIFSDDRPASSLRSKLEKDIHHSFDLPISVILKTKSDISAICKAVPRNWTNDTEQKTDVIFLADSLAKPSVLSKVRIDPELERVKYLAGSLVWNIDRVNVTRGNSIKLIKSDLYKFMTIRNINTVRKLEALMNELSS